VDESNLDSDESLKNSIREDCTRNAAANHAITQEQLDQALAQVQKALEPKLNEYYEKAWLQGGAETHLADCPEGVFFAFTPTKLQNEDAVREHDLDDVTFQAVFEAHQNMAAVFGFDVDRPTNYANKLVDDYYPIYIKYPEYWLEAQHHSRLRMKRLLLHGLTPAEALDHWALKDGTASFGTNKQEQRWQAHRDVDREAINKTLRQAREKLNDPEQQPYYEEQNITVEKVEREPEDKEFRSI